MNDEKLTILVVELRKRPYQAEIPATLAAMQAVVGGHIEAVYPFHDPVALVCNEEGKLCDQRPNRLLWTEDGKPYDVICGTFFLVGTDGDKFVSLTDDLIERYQKLYGSEMIVPWTKKQQDRTEGER